MEVVLVAIGSSREIGGELVKLLSENGTQLAYRNGV